MNRRLYVVEVDYGAHAGWLPTPLLGLDANDAKEAAHWHFRRIGDRHSVRVVAYAPHGKRVSARPLLVLRAKKRA